MDKLTILGHSYRIIFDSNLDKADRTPANICSNLLYIKIDPTVPSSRQEEGLLHEIVEALEYHLELQLPHEKRSQLSEGLYQILRQNNLIDFSRVFKNKKKGGTHEDPLK